MPRTPNAKAIAILNRAIELLSQPYGWTRGAYRTQRKDGRMSYCAVGALHKAAQELHLGDHDTHRAHNVLQQVLPRGPFGGRWPTVAQYNDRYAKNKHDVINLMKKAQDQLKSASAR